MGTRHQGNRGEIRALDAFIKLLRAAGSVSGRVHRHLSEDGLTESQFGVLEALHHLGPLCQGDLSHKLLKSGANLTTVVDNLERRGLVRRERGAEDRRYVTVHLSPEGRRLIARVFPRHVRRVVEEFAVLEPAEQERLAALCRALGRGLRDDTHPRGREEETVMTKVPRIPAAETRRKVEAGEALLVCAYDDRAKFDAVHLDGALSLQEFQARRQELPRAQEVVFYCA